MQDVFHGKRQCPIEYIGAEDGGKKVHRLLAVVELTILHLEEEVSTREEESAQKERIEERSEPCGHIAAMAQYDEEHEDALRRIEEGNSPPRIAGLRLVSILVYYFPLLIFNISLINFARLQTIFLTHC